MIAMAILAVFLAAALRMPFALWPLTMLAIATLWVSSGARRRKAWGNPMTVVEMAAHLFLALTFIIPVSFVILLLIDWAFPVWSR